MKKKKCETCHLIIFKFISSLSLASSNSAADGMIDYSLPCFVYNCLCGVVQGLSDTILPHWHTKPKKDFEFWVFFSAKPPLILTLTSLKQGFTLMQMRIIAMEDNPGAFGKLTERATWITLSNKSHHMLLVTDSNQCFSFSQSSLLNHNNFN